MSRNFELNFNDKFIELTPRNMNYRLYMLNVTFIKYYVCVIVFRHWYVANIYRFLRDFDLIKCLIHTHTG